MVWFPLKGSMQDQPRASTQRIIHIFEKYLQGNKNLSYCRNLLTPEFIDAIAVFIAMHCSWFL